MKRALILLLIVPGILAAQNVGSYIKTNNGTSIKARAFTAATSDTTEAINIVGYKTVYLSVSSPETTTVHIDYALSLDGSRFSEFTAKDSLVSQPSGATVDVFKSVDFTSTALGTLYIKWRLRHSALAFAVGTSSPTYTAFYTLKRY